MVVMVKQGSLEGHPFANVLICHECFNEMKHSAEILEAKNKH
jgi:hypothetical protein